MWYGGYLNGLPAWYAFISVNDTIISISPFVCLSPSFVFISLSGHSSYIIWQKQFFFFDMFCISFLTSFVIFRVSNIFSTENLLVMYLNNWIYRLEPAPILKHTLRWSFMTSCHARHKDNFNSFPFFSFYHLLRSNKNKYSQLRFSKWWKFTYHWAHDYLLKSALFS